MNEKIDSIYDYCPQFDSYMTEVVANLEAAGEPFDEESVAVDVVMDFFELPEGTVLLVSDLESFVRHLVKKHYHLMGR